MKLSFKLLLGSAVLVAALDGYVASKARGYEHQLRSQPAAIERWTRQIARLRAERDEALHQRDAGDAPPATLAVAGPADPIKAGLLSAWVNRARHLKKLMADDPRRRIPELALLDDSDWLSISRNRTLENDDDIRRALALLRNIGRHRFIQHVRDALTNYLKANHNELPLDTSELLPYFEWNVDDCAAMLSRYRMARSGKVELNISTTFSDAAELITEKRVPDPRYDERVSVDIDGAQLATGTKNVQDPERTSGNLNDMLEQAAIRAVRAFMAANNGHKPATPAQVLPYFDVPVPPEVTARAQQPPTPAELKAFQEEMSQIEPDP
jgi:hypothetical protein